MWDAIIAVIDSVQVFNPNLFWTSDTSHAVMQKSTYGTSSHKEEGKFTLRITGKAMQIITGI